MVESTKTKLTSAEELARMEKIHFRHRDSIRMRKFADEEILGGFEIRKHSESWGIWQLRNLMFTDKRLRNFDGDKMQRLIDITKIKGITKNVYCGQKVEFVLHIKDEYDYRICCN